MPRPRSALAALAVLTAVLTAVTLPAPAAAQEARVDLTGPFAHVGLVMGSVSRESGPAGESRTGPGWSAGGGVNLTRSSSVVGNYSRFTFRDLGAPSASTLEQTEVGVRLRVGGVRGPATFYIEGGAAKRRTSLTTSTVFATDAPADADATTDVDGWAGWFGPGAQLFFGRRLAGEVSVAWAWGMMSRARVAGHAVELHPPIGLTTLRLRIGAAVMLF